MVDMYHWCFGHGDINIEIPHRGETVIFNDYSYTVQKVSWEYVLDGETEWIKGIIVTVEIEPILDR